MRRKATADERGANGNFLASCTEETTACCALGIHSISQGRLTGYVFFLIPFLAIAAFAKFPISASCTDDVADDRQAEIMRIISVVREAELPEQVRKSLTRIITDSPKQKQWAGSEGTFFFGLVVRPLPSGQQRKAATPAVLNATHMLSVHEVLVFKAVLDAYGKSNLTDTIALRKALIRSSAELHVVGRVKGVRHKSEVHGDLAVAYILCNETDLLAFLQGREQMDVVRRDYRNVMHERMRERMKEKQWKDGVAIWDHLHSRNLASAELSLDATRCLHEVKRSDDALAVLRDAFDQNALLASADWLERCGDLALTLGKQGEALALRAYERSSDRLKSTVNEKKR